jgi:hypothetical protein
MVKRINNRESGQSVILIVLMLVGLIAMLALVLDGGNLYTQRRAAQVAADAGALAGAREYCLTGNSTAAVNRGYEYAVNRNQADNAIVSVDSASGDVSVEASITFDTFFLGVLGRPQLTAAASAKAACEPASSAFIMPIAWSCKTPSGESASEDCELYYADTADGDNDCVEGDYLYIIVDSGDLEDEIVCHDPMEPGESAPDPLPVGFVDCDSDDDGVNDIQLLSSGNRSWLDLDGGGGGASSLSDWIENGYNEIVEPHTWMAGQTGVAVSVYNTVHEEILDKQVVIPVFNSICPTGPPNSYDNCDDQWHDEDIVIESGGSSTDYFHIISFALFVPTCVDAGSYPRAGETCFAHEALDLHPNIKTIEGCFTEGVDPSLGSSGGVVDTGADVVYLKE